MADEKLKQLLMEIEGICRIWREENKEITFDTLSAIHSLEQRIWEELLLRK